MPALYQAQLESATDDADDQLRFRAFACIISNLVPGGNFASAGECRQGGNAVALLLADIRAQVSSSSKSLKKNGRLLHALLSVRNYQQGHGGRLSIDFVQPAVQPGDAR